MNSSWVVNKLIKVNQNNFQITLIIIQLLLLSYDILQYERANKINQKLKLKNVVT